MNSKHTFKSGPLQSLYYLLFQARRPMRLVNFITFFRILAFPIFIILLLQGNYDHFKWLLVVSFLTDALDGYLARKFNVSSILGSRLDSMGDDLTVLAAVIGLFFIHPKFLKEEWIIIALLFVLYLIQLVYAVVRYRKMTSFHTLLAKTSAVFQGFFMCSMFFFDAPIYWLFYTTVGLTAISLIEETIMVSVLPTWRENVKGLYWALKYSKNEPNQ